MNGRTLGILAGFAAVALAGGFYFGGSEPAPPATEGTLLFPGLTPRLAAAAKVEIAHNGETTVIEKRADGAWGVASMRGYPVQETKLRGLFAGLTELRLAEKRTNDPAMLSRLGLDDAGADSVRVLDGKGQPVAALIVGHQRTRPKGGDQVYVRLPGDNQAWLADGGLPADADPAKWLNRDVLNIARDRIASVVSGDLTFGMVDGKFALTAPAGHPRLEDYKIGDVARALETVTFEAVKAEADLQAVSTGQSEFVTKDGLAVTVSVFHADKDVWVRFAAKGTGDAAAKEAETLNAKLGGWSYRIGAWKETSLMPKLDDLKAPPAEPAKQ
jgi:hypothetical protein